MVITVYFVMLSSFASTYFIDRRSQGGVQMYLGELDMLMLVICATKCTRICHSADERTHIFWVKGVNLEGGRF